MAPDGSGCRRCVRVPKKHCPSCNPSLWSNEFTRFIQGSSPEQQEEMLQRRPTSRRQHYYSQTVTIDDDDDTTPQTSPPPQAQHATTNDTHRAVDASPPNRSLIQLHDWPRYPQPLNMPHNPRERRNVIPHDPQWTQAFAPPARTGTASSASTLMSRTTAANHGDSDSDSDSDRDRDRDTRASVMRTRHQRPSNGTRPAHTFSYASREQMAARYRQQQLWQGDPRTEATRVVDEENEGEDELDDQNEDENDDGYESASP